MVTVGTSRTLPWSWYTDPAVLQLEQERIFRRPWHYAGRADEVSEAGSFSATRAGDVPSVLVRDEEGTLPAFLNVCRHRGSLVCEGAGRRSTLQCPYHAWTYSLDGKLLSAPRAAREGGLEMDELGLVPLLLETWGPFVFVNPDPDAAPLSQFLDDVPEHIAAAGIDVGALRFLARTESEIAANWKTCSENFLECYHCPVAHPGSLRSWTSRPTRTSWRPAARGCPNSGLRDPGRLAPSIPQVRSSAGNSTSCSRAQS